MHKKVILVYMDVPPFGGSGAQRILKFARYLPDKGWSPTVITTEKAWLAIKDNSFCNEIPRDLKICCVSRSSVIEYSETLSTLLAKLCFILKAFNKSEADIKEGLKWRIELLFIKIMPEFEISWILRSFWKIFCLHKKNKFDVIITSGPSHSSHLVGLLVKLILNIRWIADFRDPWVESVDLKPKACFAGYLTPLKEIIVIKQCDLIITVSNTWKELFQNKLKGLKKYKVNVVFNGYDPDDIQGYPEAHVYCDSLHLHHSGTLYSRRNCDYLFSAIKNIGLINSDISGNIKFTFTGLSECHKDCVRNMGLEHMIRDVGKFNHKNSIAYARMADVLLLMSDKTDSTSLGAIPAKVFEYIALGLPILAMLPCGGDLDILLRKYKNAVIVEYDNIEGIKNAIIQFYNSKKQRTLSLCEAPEWLKFYTRKNQTYELVKIMEQLCN